MDSYAGFLRIRRELYHHFSKSILDIQETLNQIFTDLGYDDPTQTITEDVMKQALTRIGITFNPDDVQLFLEMCKNPETHEVHNNDVFRAIEFIDIQRALMSKSECTDDPNGPKSTARNVSLMRTNSKSVMSSESEKHKSKLLNPATLLQMRTSVASPKKIASPYADMEDNSSNETAPPPQEHTSFASVYQKIVDSVISKPQKDPEIDLEEILGESYLDNNSSNRLSSNALDVLALYIKGQKLLYTESKTYCEQQLNFLMLPAIFISCVGSIFSFLSGRYENGDLIIASLNGFNAFLLALISYLKLDAKAQAHKTSAYKFDKLESMCEFNSGKFMFFDSTQLDVMDVVKQIEKEVKEIKETNQFILPESIRYEFNFTYTTNVFMLVKKIQATEIAETNSLANLVRQINADCALYDTMNPDSLDARELKRATDIKIKKQNKCLNTILECREQYFNLDADFAKEIDKHIKRANRWFIFRLVCCDWLKS